MNRLTILKSSASAFLINICSSTCKCDLRNNWLSIENNLASCETFTDFISIWDFKFSRRRVWCSELSSGLYCRVKRLSTDVSAVRTHPWWWRQYAPLKRRSTIILHGSITQNTALNFISIVDVMKHRNFDDGPRLRFGVLVVVKTLMAVFWVVTPSSLVGGHQTVCHFLRKWTVIITYRPMNFGMHGAINPDFSGANTSWYELPAFLYKHRAYI
jgi:hypothetical protein